MTSEWELTVDTLKRTYADAISVNLHENPDDQDDCDLCMAAHAHVDRLLARVKAEAWGEGNRAGVSDQAAWDGWRYYPRDKHPIPNPYREGESDE